MKKELVSAKEILEKHGLTYQTVNHYTNLGLINVVSKKGNVRLYAEEDIAGRLARITQLINAGLPLRVIRKALDEELSVKVLNNDTGGA